MLDHYVHRVGLIILTPGLPASYHQLFAGSGQCGTVLEIVQPHHHLFVVQCGGLFDQLNHAPIHADLCRTKRTGIVHFLGENDAFDPWLI